MTRQQPAEDTTPLGRFVAYIHDREQRGRPISSLIRSLERLIVSEGDAFGDADPVAVVERAVAGYQIMQARADGTRVDNELLEDRSRAKGTLPSGKPGKGDPTARQAEARIVLDRINARIRVLLIRHGIPTGEPERRPSPDEIDGIGDALERMIYGGWRDAAIDDEINNVHALSTSISTRMDRVREQLRRNCKVCQSPRRGEVEERMGLGWTVRQIEVWLESEGINISHMTVQRHRAHLDAGR